MRLFAHHALARLAYAAQRGFGVRELFGAGKVAYAEETARLMARLRERDEAMGFWEAAGFARQVGAARFTKAI